MTDQRPRKSRKIVAIRGAALPIPQVNPDVVKACEALLDEAMSGNIAGLLWAQVSPQGHYSTEWVGNGEKHSMVAAAATLAHRVLTAAE